MHDDAERMGSCGPTRPARAASAGACRALVTSGLLAALAFPLPAASADVIFSVTADVPYNPGEIPTLEQDVLDHDAYSPSSFLIHLGDINQASEGCHEERYESISDILRSSEVPAFILPGDNEWLDCADPDQGWAWWEEHLGALYESFCFEAPVETQGARPENFAFLLDDVLFVGLNRPSGAPVDLTRDDADWVDTQFAAHADDARAVVLMAHSLPDGELETAIRYNVGAYDGPVLYIQGNGHVWDHEIGWLGFPNLERVQVDMGGMAPPVQVTVTDAGVFAFDRDPWPAGTPEIQRAECAPLSGEHVVSVRVRSDTDDAEQDVLTGAVNLASSDLELSADTGRTQVVGLRFTNLDVPRGATIRSATVRFAVDETSTGAAPLDIRGQASDDAAAFSSAAFDLSARPATRAVTRWTPPDWTSVGASGSDQQTTDLAAVVQEIVARPGWTPGNDLVLLVTGSGRRTAESYRGSAATAPVLDLVYAEPAPVSLRVRVSGSADDAEQDLGTGAVTLASSDLELSTDGTHAQLVGLRFTNVAVPPGATIVAASVQFTTDEPGTAATVSTVRAQASDDAPAFASRASDLSSRPTTRASAAWSPAAWTTVGEAGSAQRTTDLSAVLQEIVDRPGWASGRSVALLVSGTGARVAMSRDGSASQAPELVIDWVP